jgi:biopolymer transport protein TolR
MPGATAVAGNIQRPSRGRKKHGAMAEINVVPYIDVMLVLLIIFMVTAPLITQGVKVDLPQATSKPLEADDKEPLIVSIKADGSYYINLGDKSQEPVTPETVGERVAIVLRATPGTPVYVGGDHAVPYGDVVRLMTILQAAGAESVGLMTEDPPLNSSANR